LDAVNRSAAALDEIILQLLVPLRTSKTLDARVLKRVTELIDEIGGHLAAEPMVPKQLVGTLWFIFTTMLAEAAHARTNRNEIELAA
jgi:hypothetical protein